MRKCLRCNEEMIEDLDVKVEVERTESRLLNKVYLGII